jgi:hypothetical protein
MKKIGLLCFLPLLGSVLHAQDTFLLPEVTQAGKGIVNTRVDNIGYWNYMIRLGFVKPGRFVRAVPGEYTSSLIDAPGVHPQNSPDIPVTQLTNVTQSENSIFIDPGSEDVLLNSNNSSSWVNNYAQDQYGADALFSLDWGTIWQGTIFGAGETNNGDPATVINATGRWFVGKISIDRGQGVAWSDDHGLTWHEVEVAPGPTYAYGILDKNHLWIDNAASSPFSGYLYDAWTNFGSQTIDTNQIQISRSANNGITWSSPYTISFAVAAGKLNHGVNIATGPNGEVYVSWSVYDIWPSDETAIGFCKSIDGGGVFTPATRIIDNMKGIRMSLTGKNMRVNSFPSMAVDLSTGPNRGRIYLVWSNIGYPGINTGTDIDVYLIKSDDEGETWSAPLRVNQDPPGLGKQHYFPWITCDAVTGGLCVIYYDDRSLPSNQAETYISYSYDGGESWTDFKISDYSFTPAPIPGLAISYFGDYIGIQSLNMKVYPIWTDNHLAGRAMTFVSPFDLGPNPGQPWIMYYSNEITTIPLTRIENLIFGDSLWLSLGLKNIGDRPASGITSIVTSSSPYIAITDSIESYGDMDSSEIKVIQNGYALKISDTIPDNLRVRFDIRAFNTDSVWYSHFNLISSAPALKILRLEVVDTSGGNNNGRIDPGEEVLLKFKVSNTGDFPCPLTGAILSCNSEYLTLEYDSVFLDTIHPGAVKYATFQAAASPDSPTSTWIDLLLALKSELYETHASFRQSIGMLVEDWETFTFTKFDWQLGGSQPWTLTTLSPFEGIYSARSGVIGNSSNSQLWITYTSAVDDSISFYLKTSTEDGYDLLIFYIDNVPQKNWSGETPWTRAAFPVNAGTHTFRWRYAKDLSYAYGQDRVWIDFIAFPPPILPDIYPGQDDTICAGQNYQLLATASGYDSLKWITKGDGTFSDDTLVNPVYIPGTNDIIQGSVRLKITAWGTYGSITKGMDLTIGGIPVTGIEVFPNDTVCAQLSIQLSADTAGISSWFWTPGGFTTPVVEIDTSVTGGIGTHMFRLRVTNQYGCQAKDSAFLTFRDCTGIQETSDGIYVRVHPNPNHGVFDLSVSAPVPDLFLLRLYDPLNRLISEEQIPSSRIYTRHFSLNDPAPGIYLLQIKRGEKEICYRILVY